MPLSEQEQMLVRECALQGKSGTTVARELGLSPQTVLKFLKREGMYRDGRSSSHEPEVIRRCVRYHRGHSLNVLAEEAHYTSREGVKQWLKRHDLLEPWKKDRELKKARARKIAATRAQLPAMTEYFGRLLYQKEARETHNRYLTEALEKRIVVDGHTGYMRWDALPLAANLLRTYDLFQASYARAPTYPELAQEFPRLTYNEILRYLGRSGRALTPLRHMKSSSAPSSLTEG